LRPIAEDIADAPRVYVDANKPTGVVEAMRRELRWDVLPSWCVARWAPPTVTLS